MCIFYSIKDNKKLSRKLLLNLFESFFCDRNRIGEVKKRESYF